MSPNSAAAAQREARGDAVARLTELGLGGYGRGKDGKQEAGKGAGGTDQKKGARPGPGWSPEGASNEKGGSSSAMATDNGKKLMTKEGMERGQVSFR